jgi:eukaryotic-like serine/threonine-protein kinase
MNYPSAPSPYPSPGEIIADSWRIEKIMGEGGMGAVARAWDLILHTPVAIKFMNPQFLTFPGAEERFINEGKASALIKSDHVVPVMKAGKTASGTPYLVMECLEGVDLADLIARDGTPGLPIERATHFVVQVLRALQAAHAIGIIHRDMKPSNCFAVNKDGEEDFVKILDFGISKIQKPGSASLTQTNSALGTPLYMSPEQARSPRDVDARSDLYSVGVILYELLTGHTPFFSESGEFTEILFKLFTAEPPPVQSTRPDLPDELARAVHKALARDVKDRFTDALDMAEALAPFASERSKHVLTRMRAFKPPTKHSIAPPEDLPQSMVAFSALQNGPQTDLMANRPTTDVMRGPPVTEVLVRSAGVPAGTGKISTQLLEGSPGAPAARLSAVPEALDARARPEDAGARTQFDSNPGRPPSMRPQVLGAQTDLSTARDTSVISQIEAAAAPKRSPMLYALPLLAILVIVGGGLFVVSSKDKGKTVSTAAPPSALALPESSSASIAPTNVATPPSAASVATTGAPSASAAASASASATSVRAVPVVRPPQHNDPPGTGTPHVLDTKIHQ